MIWWKENPYIINLYKIATLKITWKSSGKKKMTSGKKSKARMTAPLGAPLRLCPCTQVLHTYRAVRSHSDWQPSYAQERKKKPEKRGSKYPRFLSQLVHSNPPVGVSHPPLNFTLNSQVWLKSFTEGSITDWGMIHFTSEAPKSYLWGVFECIYLTCEAFCKINMGIFQFDKSTWNIT